MSSTTDFGYTTIATEEKEKKVAQVFHSVASNYNLMNDLMSLGLHRLWKKQLLHLCDIQPHHYVLDLAGGTGDLSRAFAQKINEKGKIVLTDINFSMLRQGQKVLLDEGLWNKVSYVQGNGESLPFPSHSFHCVAMAFGLRNVTHKERALASIFRVLKPGGKLLILEFSKPILPFLDKLYNAYSFNFIPWLGGQVTGDKASYQYLVESIRMHPSQERLKIMMKEAHFKGCEYHNLTGGIVAIHKGFKT